MVSRLKFITILLVKEMLYILIADYLAHERPERHFSCLTCHYFTNGRKSFGPPWVINECLLLSDDTKTWIMLRVI